MSGLALMMRQALDETNPQASLIDYEHRHVIPADENEVDVGIHQGDNSHLCNYVEDDINCEPPLFATQTALLTPQLYNNNMDFDDDSNHPSSSNEFLATSYSTLKRAYDRDTWRMYNRISLARHWSSHVSEAVHVHEHRTTGASPLLPQAEAYQHNEYESSCLDYYHLQPRYYHCKGTDQSAFGVLTLQSISDTLAAAHANEYAEAIFDLEL